MAFQSTGFQATAFQAADTITHVPDGGFVFSGVEEFAASYSHTPTRGFRFGGAATITSVSNNDHIHYPSGGMVLSGASLNGQFAFMDASKIRFIFNPFTKKLDAIYLP